MVIGSGGNYVTIDISRNKFLLGFCRLLPVASSLSQRNCLLRTEILQGNNMASMRIVNSDFDRSLGMERK